MRVLFVEDYEDTAKYVVEGLKEAGFVTAHCRDGLEGLEIASTEEFDAGIVDIMLPRLDGLTLIDELRRQNISLPIIILSAKDTVNDRITGLKKGGDDYLVKPFVFEELLMRVQALIRRDKREAKPTKLCVGDLTLDLLTRKVHRQGKFIELQRLEYSLLEFLMYNAGRVVTKTTIMEHVWEYNFDPETNVVEVRIYSLREKVDRPYNKPLIHTVRGMGYVLEER